MTTLGIFFSILILSIFLAIILIMALKRMKVSAFIIRQSYLILVLCILGEIIAGVVLSDIEKFLSLLPGIIVLIPIVSGTRGSIIGAFSSRLTSALHLGTIKPFFRDMFKEGPLKENILATLFLTISIAILSGIIAHYLSLVFGYQSAGVLKFTAIVLISSFLSDVALIATGITISFITFKRNIDPDNMLFPINTTISDIISSLFLVVAVRIIA
jgi:mgtE-like transporter